MDVPVGAKALLRSANEVGRVIVRKQSTKEGDRFEARWIG
jgi:hypothetical protein